MARAGFAKEDLRSFIERIERLEEEKKAVSEDISEVYREAKGRGFDTKIMRIVVQLRKLALRRGACRASVRRNGSAPPLERV